MVTDAQKRAHEKYFAANYKQIKISAPKEEAEALDAFLQEHPQYSKAGFIRAAIKEKMERG